MAGDRRLAEGAGMIVAAGRRHIRLQAAREFADGADPSADQLVALDFPCDALADLERDFLAHVRWYGDLPLGGDRGCYTCHVPTAYQKLCSLRK